MGGIHLNFCDRAWRKVLVPRQAALEITDRNGKPVDDQAATGTHRNQGSPMGNECAKVFKPLRAYPSSVFGAGGAGSHTLKNLPGRLVRKEYDDG